MVCERNRVDAFVCGNCETDIVEMFGPIPFSTIYKGH